MKLKLLFIFTLTTGLTSFSQAPSQPESPLPLYNLYYLSKYITADNLSTDEFNQVYSSLKTAIGYDKENLLYDDSTLAVILSKHKTIQAFLDNRKLKKQELERETISELLAGNFRKIKSEDRPAWKTEFDGLLPNSQEEKLKNRIKYLEELKRALLDSVIEKIDNATSELVKLEIPKSSIDSFGEVNDLIVQYSQYDNKNELNKKNYKLEVERFASKYVENQTIVSDYKIMNFNAPADPNTAATEIHLNSIIQSAEQRAASSAFTLPSESDMINAMAIFLAKRAQQETAIWFMDKLRTNLNNPLIYDAFPETIKLIESLEDFKTPNFNVAWRYAISSDFVKMPKNLASSSWVQSLVFDNNPEKIAMLTATLNFGYDLNRLISEKYNYRDIIRNFYTNPEFERSTDNPHNVKSRPQELLNRSILILYILTNEFFAIDKVDNKDNFRLLSYEEIISLNRSQWLALGELIQIKYGSKFGAESTFFEDDYVNCQENISKWAGNLLITLSQFDKVNKDYQKALEGKNDISNYNFYNVWQITSQLIDNIDYKKYTLPKSYNLNLPTNFDSALIKESIDVYSEIQNKNFATAIQKTMNLVEKVSSYTKNDIILQYSLDSKDFKINLKENLSFTYNNTVYSFRLSRNIIEITDQYNNFYCITQNYSKIQPFLRFVKDAKKDGNYKNITDIDPTFNKNIKEISTTLKMTESSLLMLLKIYSFYYSSNKTNDQLISFLKTSSLITPKPNVPSNKINSIKTKSQEQLFKITSFFGDVLAAKNEQELANVIDSHALPPTSYKLKRKVAQSIDLNAYVGAQVSWLSTNGYTSLKDQFTAGITAPIGFAFTWTTKEPGRNNYGFTIDIVDLGNIVNHYLISSTQDYEPDVHFSEIFSPAIGGLYSIKNSPFVLFGNIKFLPLKTTTTENGLLNNKTFDAFIFSVGAKIDIPLINLWTRIDHRD